jgi:hypothetical protein
MSVNVSRDSAVSPDRRARRTRLVARIAPAIIGVALLSLLAMGGPLGVAAQEGESGRVCSDGTLRGTYGLVGTGIRGLGPGVSETFATVSMVTYDGRGTFTAVGASHGQITGVRAGVPVSGTYYVNADCSGGETTNIPGAPPLEDRFVIVDSGREIRTVVVSPATTIATATLRRK